MTACFCQFLKLLNLSTEMMFLYSQESIRPTDDRILIRPIPVFTLIGLPNHLVCFQFTDAYLAAARMLSSSSYCSTCRLLCPNSTGSMCGGFICNPWQVHRKSM